MRIQIAPVKNITLMSQAGQTLRNRAYGVPGIGLIWGRTGYGKTTAATWFANKINAINLRANSLWTPSAMLLTLMRELDVQPLSRCSAMLEVVSDRLAIEKRPLLVDEADYLVSDKRLVEALRDIHDMSSVPLILIGMHDFRRKVSTREQLAGRVAQWVEFKPADLEDARILADTVCEVEVADDLLAELHKGAAGSIRSIIVGLSRIENIGKRHDKDRMTLRDWGRQAFTLAGEAGGQHVN